jgi:hypothetical protein
LSYSNGLQLDLLQFANVAIFLEKGVDSDHYDFLELYIQEWKRKEKLVLDSCTKRRLDVENRGDEEWLLNAAEASESSSQNLLRNLNVGPTPILSLPYFSREFHASIPMTALVNSAAETTAI